MLIIDTSLWIDFLRRRSSEDARRIIQQAMREGTAGYTCAVAMELLVGCRNAGENAAVRELLDLGKHVWIEWVHWGRAADILRHLNQNGYRVPLSDVLTAAVAMEGGWAVACRDKHFETIRNHGGCTFEVRLFS